MLREVWNILTPRQRRWVLAAQALSLFMAFSTVAGIASIGPFFTVLSDPQAIDRSALLSWLYNEFDPDSRRSFTVGLGIAFIASVVFANLINLAGTFALHRLAWSIGNDMRLALFSEYLRRPYAFHSTVNSTALINKIIHETAYVTTDILQDGLALITNCVTAALIVATVTLVNPKLALLMLAALAGGYLLIFVVIRKRLARWGRQRAHHSTERIRIIAETFGAIKEVLIFRAQDFFRDRFQGASNTASLVSARARLAGQSSKHIMECVAVAGLAAAALLLGWQGENSGAWFGQLTVLGFAAYRLLPILQQIFAAAVRIGAARASLELIAPDLRLARIARPRDRPAESEWHERPRSEIRVKGISFHYEEGRQCALDDVSFHIPAGATVAFVGENGSGKTTLADVIAGLLVPSKGEIEVDGVALDETNRTAWQSRIAYVPQHIFLLDAALVANIALGVPAAQVDRERLQAAVKLARLEDLVNGLPGGYDYKLGERAVKLSGGQRQKIGIARALYKDASVLILDEATSSLDRVTEQELTETLLSLRGRYTTIVISHRPSIARMCDVLIRLVDGKVIDIKARSGRFEGLHSHRTA